MYLAENSNHFAQKNYVFLTEGSDLLEAFQSYLEISKDKISACLILHKDNTPVYTIGEATMPENIQANLPPLIQLDKQTIIAFELKFGIYSLGIVTPIRGAAATYGGCLISVYDQDYLFKTLSSYYKIANTSHQIARQIHLLKH